MAYIKRKKHLEKWKVLSIFTCFLLEGQLLLWGTLKLYTVCVIMLLNASLLAKGIQCCYYHSTDEEIQVQAGEVNP